MSEPVRALTPYELTVQLNGLRDVVEAKLQALRNVIDERHSLYNERDESRRTAVDAAFAAQKEGISAALNAADRAVNKAELATEKRFESVNEFRATLDNQQRTLIPRSEVSVIQEGLNEKIAQLTKQMDAIQAERIGVRGGWGYAVGVVGLLLAAGSLVMIGIRFVLETPGG